MGFFFSTTLVFPEKNWKQDFFAFLRSSSGPFFDLKEKSVKSEATED